MPRETNFGSQIFGLNK